MRRVTRHNNVGGLSEAKTLWPLDSLTPTWPCSIYRYDISIVDISTLLKNIDIDIDMVIFENIGIDIDIDKVILKNIDID